MQSSTTKKSSNMKLTVVLFILVLAIIIVPLITQKGAEFGGADGEAEGVITEINPEYEPWFSSLIEPASGEIESLLFASQAALGAGIIGYYIGTTRTKKKMREESLNDNR
ncbi:MAG: energy-coupling factor ABC transporter substrate-binding protein [Terrisporobacter othiniensis]|uniref:energy-coupling factor ABC transporter substrate-binding protein n=1 Tax=Terrisporobacter petrolearius TaxID=1460447 RepID=UPI0008E5578C|nr:energy-coupling factor ABC transporter substrate-binding protein [Terrisporobacter petrolearius]MDU4861789.1 energy-coupling factor ABC transporter substrate-binding protein [Terrisporobacter othiniensis]MDU6995049.1 energy-coupling factor ABC transporter substrate-binding protein [Terrisporobacter othiniensis]SFJ48857.1 cobalt/nickel transport protein [Terrisporobacter glycolicus]